MSCQPEIFCNRISINHYFIISAVAIVSDNQNAEFNQFISFSFEGM